MALLRLFLFTSLMSIVVDSTSCKGDADCNQSQVCVDGSCYWIRSYGDQCDHNEQCKGFNVICDSSTCCCPGYYDFDDGNCRYKGLCTKDRDCGVGYRCNPTKTCELLSVKPGSIGAGGIVAIVIGVLIFVAIIAGTSAFLLVKRVRMRAAANAIRVTG